MCTPASLHAGSIHPMVQTVWLLQLYRGHTAAQRPAATDECMCRMPIGMRDRRPTALKTPRITLTAYSGSAHACVVAASTHMGAVKGKHAHATCDKPAQASKSCSGILAHHPDRCRSSIAARSRRRQVQEQHCCHLSTHRDLPPPPPTQTRSLP
jgi:hypothetical protein